MLNQSSETPGLPSFAFLQSGSVNRRANANPDDKDFPRIDVSVDRAKNTISIETVNVTELAVYLSDAVVDLDKQVVIEVNGKPRIKKTFQRSLKEMLETRYYNNSGDYGLYPASVVIEDIDPNVPGKTP